MPAPERRVEPIVSAWWADADEVRRRLERSDAQLRTMLDVLDAAVMLIDDRERVVAVNRTAQERTRRIFGVNIVPGERLPVRTSVDDEIARALAGETLRVIHGPEGRPAHVPEYWAEVTLSPVRNADGDVIGVVYHSLDVTETVRARRALERVAAFRAALTALAPTALAAATTGDPYQHVLEQAVRHVPGAQAGSVLLRDDHGGWRVGALVGYDREALERAAAPIGDDDVASLTASGPDAAAAASSSPLHALLRRTEVRSTLVVPIVLDERRVGVLQLDAFDDDAAFERDEHDLAGVLSELVSALAGRIELERLVQAERARSQHLLHHDTLTGLPNRSLLRDRLKVALARDQRAGRRTALIQVDLSGFKRVNERYGHALGDSVLVEVARALRAAVRETDSVARLGADEFAVVATDVGDASMVDVVARRVRAAVMGPVVAGSATLEMDCSVGITLAPDDAADVETLVAYADLALARAKRAGPGSIAFFTEAVDQQVRERYRLGDDLRAAIRTGEGLWTAFQPQVALDDMRVVGVEALARWRHATRGNVPPDVFAPLAEELGLIEALSERVVDHACAALAAWRAAGVGASWRMALNVSPLQLHGDHLVELLEGAVDRHGLAIADLELEVTETAAFDDDPHAVGVLASLRRRGVSIAIDDFGTGYASLQRLAMQPIDVLKIDRRFVNGVPFNTRDTALVDTVVALARGLGLRSVAEGVETPEQLQALRERRVAVAQGYLIARPMPADEVAAWAASWGDGHRGA